MNCILSYIHIHVVFFIWDSMQKYLSCKGGCLPSVGPDQPAEVAYNSPKELVCCPLLFVLIIRRDSQYYLLA